MTRLHILDPRGEGRLDLALILPLLMNPSLRHRAVWENDLEAVIDFESLMLLFFELKRFSVVKIIPKRSFGRIIDRNKVQTPGPLLLPKNFALRTILYKR